MLKTNLGEIDKVKVSLTNISINKVRQNAPNMTGKDKMSARIIESLLFILSNRDPISTDAARLVPGIKEIHWKRPTKRILRIEISESVCLVFVGNLSI